MLPPIACSFRPNPRGAPDAPAPPGDGRARAVIGAWPDYAPTPLRRLDGLARAIGCAAVLYKDEGGRFGLGSFKALGGAYGVSRLVERRGGAQGLTVATATDGNHGRSVAWGARLFGCRAVIYIPTHCSAHREQALAALGATVVRTDGGYDDAVRRCAADAAANGWQIVSDTSWPGYAEIPAWVTDGYTVMTDEIADALPAGAAPTHAFVQGGVGALAAAVCLGLHRRFAASPPAVVVVEPEGAACLFASVAAGRAAAAPAPVHSVMAGLDCGETSPLAWQVLDRRAAAFMTVPDSATAPCMRLLADAPFGDPPIVAGESAIAGLAGLIAAMADPAVRGALGLGPESRVLLFGTERDTDPDIYAKMVGRPSSMVAAPRGGTGHA
ncbi:MAG: diaminopropionate ammonia-lyase [Rhodospirillales bacterium]